MKIFSGSSNPPLAKKIAKNFGVILGKVEIERFADSEVRVRVLENVRGSEVFVIQSLSNPVNENHFELLLLADALKRLGVKRVIAVIPYLGYARQDKVYRKGEAVSVSVLAKTLEAMGVNKIITVDAHSQNALSFFKIPVNNLSPASIFTEKIKNKNLVVVSPDYGGIKRAKELAKIIKAPLVVVEKERDLKKQHLSWATGLKGQVEGKKALIIDDIITSGRTLANAAKLLKERGARKILVFATHADFIKGTKEILRNSPIDKIFVTDTIRLEKEKIFAKLEILTVTDLISKAI